MAKKPPTPSTNPSSMPINRGHQPTKPQSGYYQDGYQPTTSGPPAGKPPSGGSVVKK